MANSIEITTATKADQQEWDTFVLSHPDATPYHLFAWGQAITEAYGHEPLYLMAKQNGNLLGILPLIHIEFSFLLNELIALPFCDVGNCLAVNRAVEETMMNKALKCSDKLKAQFIEFRGRLHSKYQIDSPINQLNLNKVRMILDLPGSSDTLMRSFKSKLRSQIRRAEKNGIIFRWTGVEGVDAFYSVLCCNMRDVGSPVHSRKLFGAVMQQYGERARIGLAEYEGKCIGAGLILSTNEQTVIPWASTLRQYNRLAPNMLLYWNCLKYAADSGRKKFDFGRSTEKGGTFRFKQQWGAVPATLTWYSSVTGNRLMFRENQVSPTRRKMIAQIWKKMPIAIANLVGPLLRKYINL